MGQPGHHVFGYLLRSEGRAWDRTDAPSLPGDSSKLPEQAENSEGARDIAAASSNLALVCASVQRLVSPAMSVMTAQAKGWRPRQAEHRLSNGQAVLSAGKFFQGTNGFEEPGLAGLRDTAHRLAFHHLSEGTSFHLTTPELSWELSCHSGSPCLLETGAKNALSHGGKETFPVTFGKLSPSQEPGSPSEPRHGSYGPRPRISSTSAQAPQGPLGSAYPSPSPRVLFLLPSMRNPASSVHTESFPHLQALGPWAV